MEGCTPQYLIEVTIATIITLTPLSLKHEKKNKHI